MYFFCFLQFWESFNCSNFGTAGSIQVVFSTKCTSRNNHFKFNQIENWKYLMFDFRLISLDRITLTFCLEVDWKSCLPFQTTINCMVFFFFFFFFFFPYTKRSNTKNKLSLSWEKMHTSLFTTKLIRWHLQKVYKQNLYDMQGSNYPAAIWGHGLWCLLTWPWCPILLQYSSVYSGLTCPTAVALKWVPLKICNSSPDDMWMD